MVQGVGWEHYRSLLAVLEQGSLSGAARMLGITQPTVGRHVTALEAAFGQALFTRSQTGLQPTELAQSLQVHAQAMQRTAAALERAASGGARTTAGTVRITASEVVAVEVLPPILARLQRSHPGLSIELVASNQVQDLLHREADIAVRMTAPQQDQLVAQRVGRIELGLHGRADYLRRHGMPGTLADLAAHVLIGHDTETPFVRQALRQLPSWRRADLGWRCDSDLAQLALIRAGAGLGICQCVLAQRDARLQRVLADDVALHLDTWVTMHADLRGNARCRVAFDALVQGLQALLAEPG
ncbi:MAG: LysR family transcriptional regulator [Burkholderiaceae bacterium]|nr:LysR family transcriptional regulator [Burkholderiaceae bacterium]